MTTQDSPVFSIVLGILLLMSVMYASGRLHQYYRQGRDRDEAFREGYNCATESLFTLATRTSTVMQRPELGTVTDIGDAPSARHRAEDREAMTTRLAAIEAHRATA